MLWPFRAHSLVILMPQYVVWDIYDCLCFMTNVWSVRKVWLYQWVYKVVRLCETVVAPWKTKLCNLEVVLERCGCAGWMTMLWDVKLSSCGFTGRKIKLLGVKLHEWVWAIPAGGQSCEIIKLCGRLVAMTAGWKCFEVLWETCGYTSRMTSSKVLWESCCYAGTIHKFWRCEVLEKNCDSFGRMTILWSWEITCWSCGYVGRM